MDNVEITPTLQILALGMPRTGTTSLRVALRHLGMPRHYYFETMCNGHRGHNRMWTDLLDRKFNSDIPITRQDFEPLLNGFTSAADWPVTLFSEELLQAYPDAKVILTVRDDPDTWYKSFSDTLWCYQRQKRYPCGFWENFWYYATPEGPHDKMYSLMMEHTPFKDFPAQGKKWYLDHNQMIRDLVPAERLLEFNAKQGWQPLCDFLGKTVPKEEYPRANRTALFKNLVDSQWAAFRRRRMSILLRWFSILMLCLAAIFTIL